MHWLGVWSREGGGASSALQPSAAASRLRLFSLLPFLAPSLLLARALLLVLVGVALLAPRPRPR